MSPGALLNEIDLFQDVVPMSCANPASNCLVGLAMHTLPAALDDAMFRRCGCTLVLACSGRSLVEKGIIPGRNLKRCLSGSSCGLLATTFRLLPPPRLVDDPRQCCSPGRTAAAATVAASNGIRNRLTVRASLHSIVEGILLTHVTAVRRERNVAPLTLRTTLCITATACYRPLRQGLVQLQPSRRRRRSAVKSGPHLRLRPKCLLRPGVREEVPPQVC
mmetsp:Transcript_166220/g.533684  ORF Transcript_166220/g.533684 Transcript_166220/m.533684 type:complete len:219 (-) Transcript_166220:901-1557(-)